MEPTTSFIVTEFYKQVAKNFFKELDSRGCHVDKEIGDAFYRLLNESLTSALDSTFKSSDLTRLLKN